MRANLSSGKGKSYFISVISFFILFIILFQSPFGIGIYREDEDEGLCLTCPQMNDDNLTSSVEDKNVGLDVEELEKVKKAIENKGAKWVAGETSVWDLSTIEKQKLCGDKGTLKTQGNEKILDGYPSSFDWRTYNGNDWTTPIRSQGSCGSCYIFGSIAVVETLANIYAGNPDLDLDLSEQVVLSCCPSCGSCSGGYSTTVLEFTKIYGVPDESCFPYEADDSIPCSLACQDWEASALKIESWGSITLTKENIIFHLLSGPVTASMEVYADFYSYSGGIYEYVTGDYLGSHLVAIVGYDDNEDYWICKNSWDTSWGENGWFRIKYGECGIDSRHSEYASLGARIISISVEPSDVDFGTIYEGGSGTSSVTITNDGNSAVSVAATLGSEVPEGFYTSYFKLDNQAVSDWSISFLGLSADEIVDLSLDIPFDTEAGTKTAMLTFWAETN